AVECRIRIVAECLVPARDDMELAGHREGVVIGDGHWPVPLRLPIGRPILARWTHMIGVKWYLRLPPISMKRRYHFQPAAAVTTVTRWAHGDYGRPGTLRCLDHGLFPI